MFAALADRSLSLKLGGPLRYLKFGCFDGQGSLDNHAPTRSHELLPEDRRVRG